MNPLAVFSGPYAMLARIGLTLLLAVSLFGYGYLKGRIAGAAKLDAYKVAQAAEGVRINTKRAEATERVVTQYVRIAGATETVTKEVEKEVIRYASTNPDGLCIDAEWIRLHNAAANNTVSQTTRILDGVLRAPGLDPEGVRFPYRVPSPINRDGELREASPLRRLDGRLAALGY